MDFRLDIVLCIDLSFEMTSCIDTVKQFAKNCWLDLSESFELYGKSFSEIRVKVIGFKNLEIDSDEGFSISRFFRVSDKKTYDAKACDAFIDKLKVSKVGNGHSNSLEAISLAFRSDFTCEGDKQRQFIVMFTNTEANKLEDSNRSNPNYPRNMPNTLNELTDIWMSKSYGQQGSTSKLKQSGKMLIVYGPQMYPWPEIYESFDQIVYNPTNDGIGPDDVSYDDIINVIVASV